MYQKEFCYLELLFLKTTASQPAEEYNAETIRDALLSEPGIQ